MNSKEFEASFPNLSYFLSAYLGVQAMNIKHLIAEYLQYFSTGKGAHEIITEINVLLNTNTDDKIVTDLVAERSEHLIEGSGIKTLIYIKNEFISYFQKSID